MSDEIMVQDRASKVMDDDGAGSKSHIQVDRTKFRKILQQALASKDLFIHLQTIAGENKQLKEKNQKLEKIITRSNQNLSQMIIKDNTRSRPVRSHEDQTSSLPTKFNFDVSPAYLKTNTFTSLQHVKLSESAHSTKSLEDSSLSQSSRSMKLLESGHSDGSGPSTLTLSSLQSDLLTDSSGKPVPDSNLILERGISNRDLEAIEKTDPCKDEATGLSLKTDGDVRSMHPVPHFQQFQTVGIQQPGKQEFHQVPLKGNHQVLVPVKVPSPSSWLSPPLSFEPPSFQSRSSLEDTELSSREPAPLEDVNIVPTGVSKHYFDVVVKELAKSKQLIKQLIARSGESYKDVMDMISLQQMVQSLEEENLRLRESNQYIRNLLVTEATTDGHDNAGNSEILIFHDKVQKLERQLDLKNVALEQLNRQCDVWKKYGQKVLAAQYSPRRDDAVFQPQVQHGSTQTEETESSSPVSVSVQTEEVPVTQPAPDKMAAMLERAQGQIVNLEGYVGNLMVEKQSTQETVELLTSQNMNLECSYQQVLLTLKELERSQDNRALQDDLRGLSRENDDLSKRMKDSSEEIKYLRYQLQSAQSDMGSLSQQKTRAEAMLKSERERASQKETQLFTQCSKYQQQIFKLEKEMMQMRTLPQSNIAHVKPTAHTASYEPTSMPLMSQKVRGDGVHKMAGHQSDPCLTLKPSDGTEEFLCHHCFRTDFRDEKSFHQHMQKCGD